MKMTRTVFLLPLILLCLFSSQSLGDDIDGPHDPRFKKYSPLVNPKRTYLRTCEDNPLNAARLDMNDYDISIGDWIIVSQNGDFVEAPSHPNGTGSMSVLFSTSNTLLADEVTRLNRVPGAVPIPEGGVAYQTWPTWNKCKQDPNDPDEDPDNLTTDIPEDFLSGGVNLVKVPARYLFVSAGATRYFSDNIDPDGDYRVMLTDEMRWDQDSQNCTTCWNDPDNFEPERHPTPEVGVTFDGTDVDVGTSLFSVDNYDAQIKYLRIVAGTQVTFENGTGIKTSEEDSEKYSLLVDGAATMNWAGGSLISHIAYIGYKPGNRSRLRVMDGATAAFGEIDVAYEPGSIGQLIVRGTGSIINSNKLYLGENGTAVMLIQDEGQASIDFVSVGEGWSDPGFGSLLVRSEGALSGIDRLIIWGNGSLEVDNGSVNFLNDIEVNRGGTISGCNTGSVSSVIGYNGSSVEPGCSVGKLIIDGDYTQEAGGALVIEIGGYLLEKEYDVLEVTGNTTLDGILQLNFINKFAPKKGDVFEFLQIGGTASGTFSNVTIKGLENGFEYDISIEGGTTKLTALNDGIPYEFPWILFIPKATN